jgi:hypothetical protein
VLSSKAHLLYIGNDPLLSKSSAALLRDAGYKVRATNPSHVQEAAREHRYSGVILCPTLSGLEMNDIVEAVRQCQPEVPIISVQVGLLGDGPHPSSSVVVDALQGPQAFIGAVRSVTFVRQAS